MKNDSKRQSHLLITAFNSMFHKTYLHLNVFLLKNIVRRNILGST